MPESVGQLTGLQRLKLEGCADELLASLPQSNEALIGL